MESDRRVDFPDPRLAPDDLDLMAISSVDHLGRQLSPTEPRDWPALTHYGSAWDPDVILTAYRHGMFPMPYEINKDSEAIGWWSPQPRALFRPGSLRVTKSMKKSAKKFRVTIDQDFVNVVRHCANPERAQGWISEQVVEAFSELHRRGQAHSVEVWNRERQLVGGLYGLEIGGLFAGESMFHLERDASKVALMHLADFFLVDEQHVIDTQWLTEHLASLGAIEIPRAEYLDLIQSLLGVPSRFTK